MSFPLLKAVRKDTFFGAARNFFDPFYFAMTALVTQDNFCEKDCDYVDQYDQSIHLKLDSFIGYDFIG